MSKTLVEELREMVELSIESNQYPTVHADAILGHLCVSKSDARELFTAIADRIEREYLPRPRFEDGEPVKFGDEFIDSYGRTDNVSVISVSERGFFNVHGYKMEVELRYPKNCTVKRPAPEVLDADGVPIHVGDTVWTTDPDEDYNVAYHVVDVRYFGDVLRVVAEDTEGATLYATEEYATKYLTHKQPDTLERIEADAVKRTFCYWGCDEISCTECSAIIDGKRPDERYGTSDCCEAKTLDLLRRQREVLERGQE